MERGAMGYTLVGLKEKILEVYPEISEHGISARVEFSEEKQTYIITFRKGDKMLFTHLEKKDADECMDGIKCMYLGLQIGQLINNFDGRTPKVPDMRILESCVTNGRTDEEGYLLDYENWDEDVAADMAAHEGIGNLTREHLEVLRFIRRHYEQYHYFPVVHSICRNISQPRDCMSERFMTPAVAWKIAGLPKPDVVVRNLLEHGEPPT
jgi:TusE/DsrC/DsvC family sulfur relay protein